MWVWLVKVQSSVARAHAPGYAACLQRLAAKFQEQRSQMSAAVTSSQLRMLAQYQGGTCSLVGWFGSQTMQTLLMNLYFYIWAIIVISLFFSCMLLSLAIFATTEGVQW